MAVRRLSCGVERGRSPLTTGLALQTLPARRSTRRNAAAFVAAPVHPEGGCGFGEAPRAVRRRSYRAPRVASPFTRSGIGRISSNASAVALRRLAAAKRATQHPSRRPEKTVAIRWNPRGNAGKEGGNEEGLEHQKLVLQQFKSAPAQTPQESGARTMRASSSQRGVDRPPSSDCLPAPPTISIARLYHALSAGASPTFRAFFAVHPEACTRNAAAHDQACRSAAMDARSRPHAEKLPPPAAPRQPASSGTGRPARAQPAAPPAAASLRFDSAQNRGRGPRRFSSSRRVPPDRRPPAPGPSAPPPNRLSTRST